MGGVLRMPGQMSISQDPATALTQVWTWRGSSDSWTVTSPVRRSRIAPARIGRTQPKQMPIPQPIGRTKSWERLNLAH